MVFPFLRRAGQALGAVLLCSVWPRQAAAGLSLEEALARHGGWLQAGGTVAAAPASDTPAADTPDGITLAAGSRTPLGPLLSGRVLQGERGLQVRGRNAWGDGGAQLRWALAVRDGSDPTPDLDGTELGLPLGPGHVYASVERRHWGPAWTASLILDGSAPAVPALGWRKTSGSRFETPWLDWLGPWKGDLFIGRLSGNGPPDRVRLIGMRLQFMPVADLELGLSRTIQWGGSGRPQGPRSLLDALLGKDNVDAGGDTDNEPGNQLAGFDARYTLRLSPRTSLSAYGQAIGEDEAGALPSHYLGSAGVDAALALEAGSVRVFAEWANTVAGGLYGAARLGSAYRHHLYPQGYTQRGRPLGHPAGGDVRLGSAGLLAEYGPLAALLMVHAGRAEANGVRPAGPLRGADASLRWRGDRSAFGASLSAWRGPAAGPMQLQLWWQQALP